MASGTGPGGTGLLERKTTTMLIRLLTAAAAGLAAFGAILEAHAQSWPTRNVKLIVPLGPAGYRIFHVMSTVQMKASR